MTNGGNPGDGGESGQAENVVCLVCENHLDPGTPDTVEVGNLYWHEKCLDYIPATNKWDQIDQETGHAIRLRNFGDRTVRVDMSVLLRVREGFFDARGGYDDEG